ncbi:serine/threonine-protein kinase TOR-like [Dorcoceras hygrometricum]|uniref:Serine/threonine-protein kinase TOR-like n=1 Tax=Dorcoceras hygrometricum TaxID=472368 RepID=A0A2Z7AYD7_9LAMI|nr:serine/threonine-protein kinase TOR-like [Dorcoceras hygrometricum]
MSTTAATAGCPVVGREMLATGFPNDWLDQTMSYQLIQTTSFAMHPRLVEYNAVALDWMYCSCLLVISSQDHLLNRHDVVSTYSNDIVCYASSTD